MGYGVTKRKQMFAVHPPFYGCFAMAETSPAEPIDSGRGLGARGRMGVAAPAGRLAAAGYSSITDQSITEASLLPK